MLKRLLFCLVVLATITGVPGRAATPTGPAEFVVTNTDDAQKGCLREAFEYANAHPGTVIRFNIPRQDPGYRNGVFTIAPLNGLPALTASGTVIDGASQTAFTGDTNAVGPEIVLRGSHIEPLNGFAGFIVMKAARCAVRNVILTGFNGNGIIMRGEEARDNTVQGCFIGTDATGMAGGHCGDNGIIIDSGSSHNLIGGTVPAQRNLLSGLSTNGNAVLISGQGSDGNTIQGNYIGINRTGTGVLRNLWAGIKIEKGASRNLVGGVAAGARNVITGNYHAVEINDTGSNENVIQGNYIGTTIDGLATIVTSVRYNDGIHISNGASSNVIGGTVPGARNVIAANDFPAIWISHTNTCGNIIQGNYIGINAAGGSALASSEGVYITSGAHHNLIGGTTPAERNVISGNRQHGVWLASYQASGNIVQGNYIGTDATGTKAVPNGTGVSVSSGGTGNEVGGSEPGAGNLIAGNTYNGVNVDGKDTRSNTVQGNLIGTDISGTNPLPNGCYGISLFDGANNNLIGGKATAARNLIAGNARYGIYIGGKGTAANRVLGNFIGTDLSGAKPLPNGAGLKRNGALTLPNGFIVKGGGAGVHVAEGAALNIIGEIGAANRIAFNEGDGVHVMDASAGNSVRGNSIWANTGLGIDLRLAGEADCTVTPNHARPVAAAPNLAQPYPVFTVQPAASGLDFGTLTVRGTLESSPQADYIIDFYGNAAAAGGHGQGEQFLSSTIVTTDVTGKAVFDFDIKGSLLGKVRFLTATATAKQAGDTSEFSAAVAVP